MREILNKEQKKLLSYFSKNNFFRSNFYWTGGTALAELYLKHRLSVDLDFFSEELIADELLLENIKKLKKELKIKKVKYIKDKNRQIFSLVFSGKKAVKLEFVYFPFSKIRYKKVDKRYKIKVDSLKSIGENKILALYESSEPKHIFDIYWICKKYKILSLKKLYFGALGKFGVEIDKVNFIEKAFEAIERLTFIKPLFMVKFKVDRKGLVKFLETIK